MKGWKERREASWGEKGREWERNKGEKREKGHLARETPFSCQLPLIPAGKLPSEKYNYPNLMGVGRGVCEERPFGTLTARSPDICDLACP